MEKSLTLSLAVRTAVQEKQYKIVGYLANLLLWLFFFSCVSQTFQHSVWKSNYLLSDSERSHGEVMMLISCVRQQEENSKRKPKGLKLLLLLPQQQGYNSKGIFCTSDLATSPDVDRGV